MFIDRYIEGVSADRVVGMDYAAGRMAGEHLVACGYQRIGYFDFEPIHSTTSKGRLAGLLSVLEEKNIKLPEQYFVKCVQRTTNRVSVVQDLDFMVSGIRSYLETNPDLEAVVAFNDAVAVRFYAACQHLNLIIPTDLAVISFGDLDLAQFLAPTLTSFNQQTALLGQVPPT